MTDICIDIGEKLIWGELNDTMAAREFCRRLPYCAPCRKNDMEYYSPIPRGVFDPLDIGLGFQRGDILLWDGWLRFPYVDAQGETAIQKSMVIGHIRDISELQYLPENFKILIKESSTE